MKRITKYEEIKPENINWGVIGVRVKQYREQLGLSQSEADEELDLRSNTIKCLEGLKYEDRKTVNVIWRIVQGWNLSVNWLLNGEGDFYDADPIELLPETLLIEKGAGIPRSRSRAAAENGRHGDLVMEFIIGVDKFKSRNEISFPTWSQVFEIILALGYRKVQPARIAPLGYIVEEQELLEGQKHVSQKQEPQDTSLLDKQIKHIKNRGKRTTKQYFVVDPSGRQHITKNGLSEFCRHHDLNYGKLIRITDKTRTYDGWKITYLPDDKLDEALAALEKNQ